MRDIQLRAVLIPLIVAVILVAGLMWYRMFWIPGQQQYLNERNSRILRTIAAQIASKVDNFDQSIDNAMDSWGTETDKTALQGYERFKDFPAYVKLFAPDIESTIVIPPSGTNESVVRNPGDPPRVRITRDEGTNYLYLGYKHEHEDSVAEPAIQTKADIEKVIRPYLAARTEFEALIVTDGNGRAIAQYSTSGLRLERVDKLEFFVPGQAAARDFASVSESGRVSSVTIGEIDYKFYAQPVALSLDADGDTAAQPSAKPTTQPRTGQPEEWILCGLVRSSRFGAESLAIPPKYWLLFVEALMVICLAVPIMKLHVLQPRERFYGTDGAWVTGATFLLAGLITIFVFDQYYFSYLFKSQNDTKLEWVAGVMTAHLQDEVKAARSQIDALRRDPASPEQSEPYARDMESWPKPRVLQSRGVVSCDPLDACRTSLLQNALSRDPKYPYFELVSWFSGDGLQLVKWSTAKGPTPFISLRDAKVPYLEALERDNARPKEHDASAPGVGISVLRSPNTGNTTTVVWESLGYARQAFSGASMTMALPISVTTPVLPRAVQFAVIDETGRVMFHSQPTRSLEENFFQESEENAELRSAIKGRQRQSLTVQYLGTRQRLFVAPLPLADLSGASITVDPKWSLVVFQAVEVPDTINLETVMMAAGMFALYCAMLAAVWGLAMLAAPARVKKWFWPNHTKGGPYLAVFFANLALSALYLLLVDRSSPLGVVIGAAGIATAGVAATFAIVTFWPPAEPVRQTWRRDFFLARLSFLFVAAAVPAMACFQAAFTLETDLLVRSEQLHMDADLKARNDRIQDKVQTLALQDQGQDQTREEDQRRTAYLSARQGRSWDLAGFATSAAEAANGAPLLTPADRAGNIAGPPATGSGCPGAHPCLQPGTLDGFVAFMLFPLNDEAEDLRLALLGTGHWWLSDLDHVAMLSSGGGVMTSVRPRMIRADWSQVIIWGIAAVAAGGLGLLLYLGVMPMFMLNIIRSPGTRELRASRTEGNLLLVGPPGAAKTERLKVAGQRGDRAPFILDARTDTFDPARVERDPVCVDHFEHGLDTEARRDRMLGFLEELAQRDLQVWIAAAREPLDHLRERSAKDLDRWNAVFHSYRLETVGLVEVPHAEARFAESPLRAVTLRECSMSRQLLRIGEDVLREGPADEEELLSEIGEAAEPYYQALWAAFGRDSKLALQQLAAEGVMNPRNGDIACQLLMSGVVRRDPTFRVMNETFRRFVLEMASTEEIEAWERVGVETPWSSYALSAATVAAGLGAVLFLTQQQLFDAWIGYVPALVPAATTVSRLFARTQSSSGVPTGSA